MVPLSKAVSSSWVKKLAGLWRRSVVRSRSPRVDRGWISNRWGLSCFSIRSRAVRACVTARLLGRVPTLKVMGDLFIEMHVVGGDFTAV